ncbi:hypothetical protein [Caballeronia temeraria]|uniref:hypothetical protein n=1 Tax=Caballeronia temeraria TaxID=1777137 RepID=UPI000ADD0DF4|nr:hypothetical protein [Caballeronia temeraria]
MAKFNLGSEMLHFNAWFDQLVALRTPVGKMVAAWVPVTLPRWNMSSPGDWAKPI